MFLAIVMLVLAISLGVQSNSEYVATNVVTIEEDWALYRQEAVEEYSDMFTELFNSYEVKRAKNGALMIRSGNSGSYRFAKKG